MGDITRGQRSYDFKVDETGCKESREILDCLQGPPWTRSLSSSSDQVSVSVELLLTDSFFVLFWQELGLAWMPS